MRTKSMRAKRRAVVPRVQRYTGRLVRLVLSLTLAVGPMSAAAQDVVVRVTVVGGGWADCGDGLFGGPPEIYWRVFIDGALRDNEDSPVFSNISPFGTLDREFSQSVDFSRGSIPIVIEQWDDDGGLTFDDDQCDISPSGKELDLSLDLAACTVTGDVSGSCGETIVADGSFRFVVEVDEPPSAPGLQTTCIHSPLWPQPGETVTITANSLDGSLASRLADSIEIWVDDRSSPVSTGSGFFDTFTTAALAGPSFNYGCRIVDDGLTAWTGWRTVAVGTSELTDSYGERIPVLYTGPRSSRVDLVFYADRDSYSGSTDPAFLSDVENAITNAYFTEDVFLTNQDAVNYWIALGTGKADPDCDIDAPQEPWEDAGAVFHTDNFRDCAPGGKRVFSTEPTSLRTMIHETGHRPFGLADEYCCDGGYFQNDPFPNLYDLLFGGTLPILGCGDDAPTQGLTAADCRTFDEDVPWWFDDDWYTTDPGNNDLMVDNTMRQPLDDRRINWFFSECRGASC